MPDLLLHILLALLPAAVVFATAYYLLRMFFENERQARAAELRKGDHKQVLPLRLQACERLTLFLERISPGALVLRVHKSHMDAAKLHGHLVATIREEFEHNLSQQVYLSDATWLKVKQAKEETLRLINLSYEQTGGAGSSTDLSRKIFENLGRLSHTPSQEGLLALREEVRRLF